MSSVGSLSSSTSSSIRGYGGLASGLDRDELIKGMTLGTTNKITKQEQKKQQLQWKQEAIQSISSTMIDFHSKYTETLTSPTNLFSSMLWGRNKITTSGVNSKYVSVTGTASAADAITIMGIKQKAENASWSSSKGVSDGTMKTGKFASDMVSKTYTQENLVGKSISFKYGESSYSIYLSDGDDYNYKNADEIADSINKLLEKQTTSDEKKLSSIVKAKAVDGKITFEDVGSAGNHLELTGGSALELLGLSKKDADGKEKIVNDGKFKNDAGEKVAIESEGFGKITEEVDFFKYIDGKSLSFSYNGASTNVKLDGEALRKAAGANPTNEATVKAIADSIQEQLDKAFGKGRIDVDGTDGELSFRTTIPGGGEDKSSIFTFTGGDLALVGNAKGALLSDTKVDGKTKSAFQAGDTTRLNLKKAIPSDVLKDLRVDLKDKDGNPLFDKDGNQRKGFMLNGVAIDVKENATYKDVIDAINKSDAGVTVAYQEAADKFTFTAKEKGASGVIDFSGNGEDTLAALQSAFGLDFGKETSVRGKDAIVSVKYAGSDEIVNLRRDSNSFTVDGLTIGIKGTFGEYDAAGELTNVQVDQAVEIDASVDVDKVYNTIKDFVDSYNSIVDMVNKQLTTKHEKDYDPLTSDQKGELSDDEIEKWEEKAKEGLLYGDSDLRSLSMDLRVVVSGGLLAKFEEIGISLSSTYSDNGKLSIDESKLRGALQTNPEKVQDLFTSQAGVDANGNQTYNGLATNLKSVMNKYVNTMGAMESKGILIRKAGSKSSALSLTQNTYYNQIKTIDETLEKLKAKLKTEQDRYISQFSTLETLIANMNSQSSYLSSMSGY